MVLCLEIRKMSLNTWKDVPSLTIFSNSMFIFLTGQLQILASALQEMRISSFRTMSQSIKRSRNANRNYSRLIIASTMPGRVTLGKAPPRGKAPPHLNTNLVSEWVHLMNTDVPCLKKCLRANKLELNNNLRKPRMFVFLRI